MSLGFQCSFDTYVVLLDMPPCSPVGDQTIWCCNQGDHNRIWVVFNSAYIKTRLWVLRESGLAQGQLVQYTDRCVYFDRFADTH
jgi:hypothetical protein